MTQRNGHDALLVLEDGGVFSGRAAAPGTAFGEVVFNTAMTGYQEILTDPSYRGQIVVMTMPHIGNYGTQGLAAESQRPWAEAFIAHQFTRKPSGLDPEQDLPGYLRSFGVPAMDGLDTRALVRRLRERGALRGVVTTERSEVEALLAEVRDFPTMEGRALAHETSRADIVEMPAEGDERWRIAVYDFGVKSNILRSLAARGARVLTVPSRTPAREVIDLGVDGVVLSNGPGDPEPLADAIEEVRELLRRDVPVLGICLGHQLLGLAMGARTYKLKFGHHGANQPVRDVDTGRVSITSQNHGFAVDPETLPAGSRATEYNLNDGTLEAFAITGKPVVSAQYHPEAAPGPHDASGLFDRFLRLLPPAERSVAR